MFRLIYPFLKMRGHYKVFVVRFDEPEEEEYLDLDNPEDDRLQLPNQ